ncbi:MAG: carboxypeptidase-like regulatory domain-containing protein, partial [Candidatus Latescibacteria bacterium]|nr:carboxypeptidase-like regulatory domain-containing protein [Candidatus Latescibacterota bacterium]
MRKFLKTISMIALSCLVAAGISESATTGKVQGVVRDAQTGEPLPGANVVIDGTQRGSVTDGNGFFVILLVDPGTYSMTGSMVGYDAQRQTGIKVQSDFTTTIDFAVRETALQLGEITVIAERPPVEPDKTTSKYMMSAEDLE